MALFQERKLSNPEIIGIVVMVAGIYFAREYWNKPATVQPPQEVQQTQP